MRDGARLVNAARGALVDEEALVEAIRSGQARRRGARRVLGRAVHGPAARARQRRRHAAPRRLDRRGAGPGRRDRRRAGRRRARGRARHERGQHPGRGQGATSRCSGRSSRSRRSSAGSRSSSRAGGRSAIVVAAHGPLSEYDTRLLTVAALNGVFQGRVDQVVNYVNASLIAAERGIDVAEERFRASRDYMNLVEVRVTPTAATRSRSRGRRSAPSRACSSRRARLRHRHRARAAHGLLPLRRRARRDRPRRHDVRRGRREHREHGRLADARGPAGADGAFRRRAAAAGAGRRIHAEGFDDATSSSSASERAMDDDRARIRLGDRAVRAHRGRRGCRLPAAWLARRGAHVRSSPVQRSSSWAPHSASGQAGARPCADAVPEAASRGARHDGPFAVVRHPIYLGFLGVFVGYGLLTSVLALASQPFLASSGSGRPVSRSGCSTPSTPITPRTVRARGGASFRTSY